MIQSCCFDCCPPCSSGSPDDDTKTLPPAGEFSKSVKIPVTSIRTPSWILNHEQHSAKPFLLEHFIAFWEFSPVIREAQAKIRNILNHETSQTKISNIWSSHRTFCWKLLMIRNGWVLLLLCWLISMNLLCHPSCCVSWITTSKMTAITVRLFWVLFSTSGSEPQKNNFFPREVSTNPPPPPPLSQMPCNKQIF